MKRSIIFASMAIAAGLTLTNMYTSIVDAPSWGSDIPHSMETARAYFKDSDPGNFFRIFSPLNQFFGLLCVILFWKRSKNVRWFLVAACLLYFTAEGMTFKYFYPRNDIMFFSKTTDVGQLRSTWLEWRNMNWVRTLIVASGVVCSAMALHFSYTAKAIAKKKSTAVFASEQAAVA
jgi:hypothetical protein